MKATRQVMIKLQKPKGVAPNDEKSVDLSP